MRAPERTFICRDESICVLYADWVNVSAITEWSAVVRGDASYGDAFMTGSFFVGGWWWWGRRWWVNRFGFVLPGCWLEVKHFCAPFYFHHIWSQNSQRARNTTTPPLLYKHARTRALLNYAKRPFNKYGPQNTIEPSYSDISPTFVFFFFLSSLDARPRDKPLNKYQVIKLHQPFVIRVFSLIPNCSWIFLMLSW